MITGTQLCQQGGVAPSADRAWAEFGILVVAAIGRGRSGVATLHFGVCNMPGSGEYVGGNRL